jgi:tetratricopeptide (TPR) repeat protein
MRIATMSCLALGLFLAAGTMPVRAQDTTSDDRPQPLVPLRPETREELAHREALQLYGRGLLRQHQDRLIDAMHTFEEALQLDPEAPPVYKALIPLYLALGRGDDALKACRKTLDLDPGDYETWTLYARQLRSAGRPRDARAALVRGLACVGLAEHPEQRVQMQYDLGVLTEDAHDYDDALAAFADVVKVLDNPQLLLEHGSFNRNDLAEQAANTSERMIKLCIQAKQYDRALSLFDAAQKKHPSVARRLTYNLARVHQAQGHPDKALASLEQFLRTQPYDLEPYELLITLLRELGQADRITPALRDYSRRDAHNIALHLLLARQLGQAGQVVEAEAEYRRLAEESPTPQVYHGLFGLYRQDGSMREALKLFDQAIAKSTRKGTTDGDPQYVAKARAMLTALREDSSLVKAILPQAQQALIQRDRALQDRTQYLLAVLGARAHQLEQAEFLYRRCLQELNAQLDDFAVYGGLIDVLFQAHKYEAVVEICRLGLHQSQTTNHVVFHRALSRALAFLGKMEEALTEADLAIKASSEGNRLWMRLNRINVLTYGERYPQALEEVQALFKEFPQPGDSREIRMGLYEVYSAMHNFPHAEEQLQLILKSDPDDATANNDLGYLWADQGKNLEQAEKLIRRALELDAQQRKTSVALGNADDRDNAAYVDSLGWVLFRRGQLKAACEWLEKAVALPGGEDDPTVWDHLGDVYFRMEEASKARAAWKKSVELYETTKWRKPDDHYKEVKHKLEFVDSQTQP